MKAYSPQKRYRLHTGYLIWLLHRITGLGLVTYLLLHIWVIHHITNGEKIFNQMMDTVQSPLFHFFEIILLGAVVLHSINGIRIIMIDFGKAGNKGPHITWVWITLFISIFLTVLGGIPLLKTVFQ